MYNEEPHEILSRCAKAEALFEQLWSAAGLEKPQPVQQAPLEQAAEPEKQPAEALPETLAEEPRVQGIKRKTREALNGETETERTAKRRKLKIMMSETPAAPSQSSRRSRAGKRR